MSTHQQILYLASSEELMWKLLELSVEQKACMLEEQSCFDISTKNKEEEIIKERIVYLCIEVANQIL